MPWSSWLLLPSSVVLSTGKVNSLSGPATATGGLLFSVITTFSSCMTFARQSLARAANQREDFTQNITLQI